jgi:hypothetical protein
LIGALLPLPTRWTKDQTPPNCAVHGRGRLRPLYVDSGRQLR